MASAPARITPREKASADHVRFMRNVAVGIPDPAVYAGYLPAPLAVALRSAWRRNPREYAVDPYQAQILRPYGLAGYESENLTAFGMKVRKALLAMVDQAAKDLGALP